MANYYGVNETLRNLKAIGSNVPAKFQQGKMYCSTDWYYAPAGNIASGSVIYCGVLPKGAVVSHTTIEPIDTATNGALDAMTNAVTGTIGIMKASDSTVYDADYLGTFTSLAAAAAVQTMYPKPDGTVHTTPAAPLEYDALVYVTTGGAAIAETEGFCLKVFYTLD